MTDAIPASGGGGVGGGAAFSEAAIDFVDYIDERQLPAVRNFFKPNASCSPGPFEIAKSHGDGTSMHPSSIPAVPRIRPLSKAAEQRQFMCCA